VTKLITITLLIVELRFLQYLTVTKIQITAICYFTIKRVQSQN